MHGSQNLGIEVVEPRHARDIRAFSNQEAIYATTDGIWVIYFAILNRKLYPEHVIIQLLLPGKSFYRPAKRSDVLLFDHSIRAGPKTLV